MRTPRTAAPVARARLSAVILPPDLRKEIEFESSFDGGSLLIGEHGVHEQIR
jgi:hypothetical protein